MSLAKIGAEHQKQARQHRLQVMLQMLVENSPMTFTEIWHGLGEIAKSRDTVTDDVAILINRQQVITLERRRYPTLICLADFPLHDYPEYAVKGRVAQMPVVLPRPSAPEVVPAADENKKPVAGVGVKVTELGPGHRLVSFGQGYKCGRGQRQATGFQKHSSIVNIYG